MQIDAIIKEKLLKTKKKNKGGWPLHLKCITTGRQSIYMQGQRKIVLKKKKSSSLKETKTFNIKNEVDFLSEIRKKLKSSKQCQLCKSLIPIEKTNYLCNNFEAMWYHRDTDFAFFADCAHFKSKC